MHEFDETTQNALVGDDVVLRRTVAGQHEVVAPSGLLGRDAMRLLLLVNGHTPLCLLAEHCAPGADVGRAVRELAERGLVLRV